MLAPQIPVSRSSMSLNIPLRRMWKRSPVGSGAGIYVCVPGGSGGSRRNRSRAVCGEAGALPEGGVDTVTQTTVSMFDSSAKFRMYLRNAAD